MNCLIRSIIFLLFVLVINISLQAHITADSTVRIPDSCSIYLNRNENTRSISSQIGTIGYKQLSAGYSLNILSALSGKINGVDIKTATSGNSASSVFFMRGDRSLISASQPLYVVDGIPITGSINSNLGFDYGNLLNDWNLDDIESVTILKSGQAASLYGNRGGNGAVIIQTKKAGETGFHVDYNASVLMRRNADYPDFQNSYGQGYDGEFKYADGVGGGINDGTDGSWGPRFNGQLITQFDGIATGWINGQTQQVRGGDTWARNQAALQGIDNSIVPTPWISQPDNVKSYFRTAYTLANNLGLSWANQHGAVRLSYTNVKADDVTPNTHYSKNTLGGNFNYTLFDKLKLFGTFQNASQKDGNIFTSANYNHDNPMTYFAWMSRQVNTNNLKNCWQAGQDYVTQFNYLGIYSDNPWFTAYENESPTERKNFFGSYGLRFEVTKGLSLNYNGGINKVNTEGNQVTSQGNLGGYHTFLESENFTQTSSRHSLFADYSFRLGKADDFNFFTGLYYEKSDWKSTYSLRQGNYGETSANPKTNGYYGGISYVGKNAYSARITLSRDSYSGLEKIKTPLFYSVSGGVEIDKLLNLPKIISTLNVQSGYSTSGLNTLPVIDLTSLPTEQNHFSVISEYTLSAGLGVLNNRILGRANYYNSRTKYGQLLIIISNGLGYGTKVISTASVQNTGYEISLDFIPVQTDKIRWNASVSYFKNKNEVLELAEGITAGRQYSENVDIRFEKGQPTGNLYGTKFKRQEGQLVYENGLPQYSSNYEYLGNVNPDYMMFFGNTVTINKIVLSFNIEYSKGGVYYSPFYSYGTSAGNLSNTANRENGAVGDGVKFDDASSSYIKNDVNVSTQDFFSNIYSIDEYSLMDATYLKLKEINVAYSFILKQKLNMTCSIFGQNIFTWSKNKDYNNGNLLYYNSMYYRGVNDFNLPETYVLGMKLQLHI